MEKLQSDVGYGERSLPLRKADCNISKNDKSKRLRSEEWMKKALEYADDALKRGEVPVGCLFIFKNEIIAIGSNTVNETKNATRHAELNCVDTVLEWCANHGLPQEEVFKQIKVVVTVEPCIMCAAAMLDLNISHIIYGCANSRFGGFGSVLNVKDVYDFPNCIVESNILSDEAINYLKLFYKGENPNAPKDKVKKKKNKDQITNFEACSSE